MSRPTCIGIQVWNVLDEDVEEVTYENPSKTPGRIAWESEYKLALRAANPWRAVVLGRPGQGKSLLIGMLARKLAISGHTTLCGPAPRIEKICIPVVVRLHDLASITQESGESQSDFLQRALTLVLQAQSPSRSAWNAAIDHIVRSAATRSVLLLLDALDEVPDPPKSLTMLEIIRTWDCHVVVSSRPHAYAAVRFPFDVTEYRLAPFSRTQIEVFTKKWFLSAEQQGKNDLDLATSAFVLHLPANPLLLSLWCAFAERHGLPNEITQTELYAGVLRDILGLDIDTRSTIDHQRAEAWLPLVTNIVWHSVWEGDEQLGPIGTGELLAVFARSDDRPTPLGVTAAGLRAISPMQQAEFLLEELRKKGLLLPIDRGRSVYAMLHPSFSEYLLASAFVAGIENHRTLSIDGVSITSDKLWEIVDKKAWSPRWRGVICFIAGQLDDPWPLLGRLGNAQNDNCSRHRLNLARACHGQLSAQTRKAIVNGFVASGQISQQDAALLEMTRHELYKDLFYSRLLPVMRGDLVEVPDATGKIVLIDRKQEITAVGDRLRQIASELPEGRGRRRKAAELVKLLAGDDYRSLTDFNVEITEGPSERSKLAEKQASRISPYVELLYHEDELIRASAVWIVAVSGAAGSIPDFDSILVKLLLGRRSAVRMVALDAVRASRAAARFPKVLECVFDRSLRRCQAERDNALDVIVGLGPTVITRNYLRRLSEMLSSSRWHVEIALSVLQRLGERAVATEIIDGLVQILRADAALPTLRAAILTIHDMGREAARTDVAQCLVDLSKRAAPEVRAAVAMTIPSMGVDLPPPGTVAVINELLHDHDLEVQQTATDVVRHLIESKEWSEVTHELVHMLQAEPDGLSWVLAQIGHKVAPGAIPPNVLGHLMRREGHPEYGFLASESLEALMRRGLRIFVDRSGPAGEVYRRRQSTN